MAITVYIVDDHPFVREGLRTFLGAQADLRVLGDAGDGRKALAEIAALHPDLAVVDLRLPGLDGIALTESIREASPGTKVVILSSYCEDEEALNAVEAGAIGYVFKDAPPGKLLEALRAAVRDEPTLPPMLVKGLLARARRAALAPELTGKEREVLALMVKGRSNKEIAGELAIGETTVKTHVSNILRKLGVDDRTQAVVKAIREKLVRIRECE